MFWNILIFQVFSSSSFSWSPWSISEIEQAMHLNKFFNWIHCATENHGLHNWMKSIGCTFNCSQFREQRNLIWFSLLIAFKLSSSFTIPFSLLLSLTCCSLRLSLLITSTDGIWRRSLSELIIYKEIEAIMCWY